MLGSLSEADDAVQEAWLRLSRADAGGVENLGGWLTTVVARVCLDMLRSRKPRREEPLGRARARDPAAAARTAVDPEQEALLADSVGLALLVVLDTLAPGRAARVRAARHVRRALRRDRRHRGPLPTAARQLASRARRRVQGTAAVPGRRPGPPAARSSTRSSPPRATATSTRCSRCSTPTSCSGPTAPPCPQAPHTDRAARRPWPGRRSASRGPPGSPQPALVNGAVGRSWSPRGRPLSVIDVHGRPGPDRRDRDHRRPRPPPRARPGRPGRLTRGTALAPSSSVCQINDQEKGSPARR